MPLPILQFSNPLFYFTQSTDDCNPYNDFRPMSLSPYLSILFSVFVRIKLLTWNDGKYLLLKRQRQEDHLR